MKTKRTQEEILARIEKLKEVNDLFSTGFAVTDLIEFLNYENAKSFLISKVTPEEWKKCQKTDPIQAMKDYMPFAWMKAMDERGLSASRSITHMKQWLWLAHDDKLFEQLEAGLYGYYGTVALKTICKHYKIPMVDECGRKFKDHVWEKDL